MNFSHILPKIIFLLSFTATGLTLAAQVKLPALFSDNMVLQQQSTVAFWGWAAPGAKISITAGWLKKPVSITAGANGKWITRIKTTRAGGPYTIRFIASNSITLKNVLLGEVWLASGQSNMEFFLGKMKNASYTGVNNYEAEIKKADYPNIRMIDVANKAAQEPQDDFTGEWKICSLLTADSFSAVAYYFARAIQRKTGYPIGIINATWGGTPAESWTKKELLENDADFKPILDRYHQRVNDYPEEEKKYIAALEKWKEDSNKAKGLAPKDPVNPVTNSKSPYVLYNGMIAPIIPFTLHGVIWYQGESNADRAWQYRRLFPAMIESWRKDWNNKDLPFYFLQISPHRSQNPVIREAQLYAYHTVPHTGIAITIDNGDSLDIHPRNKELVGERLSLWALHNEYGEKNIVYSSPLYKSMKKEGERIRIFFDSGDGLAAKDGELNEFTIAGADQQFVPAQARIEGNTVVVWSDAVKDPVAVRFAWRNFPKPHLYNKAGLPASPFRTDNWRVATEGIN
jgi:sialate O-acetylesterase